MNRALLALLLACSGGSGGNASDPGSEQGPVDPAMAVRINEVVAKAEDDGPDWVELYNLSSQDIDLSGFSIKDKNDAHKFTFPAGSVIKAKGFLVVNGKGGVEPHLDFAFKSSGDTVRLFSQDSSGYDVIRDQAEWQDGQAPKGSSYGRYPDGTGPFATLTPPTRGMPNVAPK